MSCLSFIGDHFPSPRPFFLLSSFPPPSPLLPHLLAPCPLLFTARCSPPHPFLPHSIELNLSATESALTVIPHYRPLTSHGPKTFKVLCCFLCLHCHVCFSPFTFFLCTVLRHLSNPHGPIVSPWPYTLPSSVRTLSLQANQSVRLFHREYECYISAEGSFAEDKQAVVEDGRSRESCELVM